MAQGWSQRPNFVPIRLNELFNGLQVEHTDDYVRWPWSAGWAGGTSRKCGCSCCAMTTRCAIRCSGGSSRWKAAARSRWPTSTSSRARNSTGTTRSCCWPTKARWSRGRALRRCLEALNRDFSAYRAGWFSRVYASLAPTPEETAADQPLLRLCLGSSITATVSLGVKQLEVLHKHGLLDAAPFVQACGGAFRGRRRRRCRCCACWRRWARGPRSSPTRWRRRWLWAWGIRMPTCSGRR